MNFPANSQKVEVSDEPQNRSGRSYLSLHNPLSRTRSTVRYLSSIKVSGVRALFTGDAPKGTPHSVDLLEYTTKAQVTDVHYFPSFFVKLRKGATPGYFRRLGNAVVSVEVDYEVLVSQKIQGALDGKAIVFPKRTEEPMIFSALGVENESSSENPSKWLGYILPSGSRVKISLNGIPSGGGLVKIETGWIADVYTAKPREVAE